SYNNRSKKLAEALERMHSENPLLFTYKKQNTIGIHTCLEVHKTSISDMLIQRLSEMQISIDAIDKNYVKSFSKQRLLKLNVSNVKEDRIEEGIRKVVEEIKQVERLNFQFKKRIK
ncbi:PLP-dependent aminotransferase family protein, partial [Bacillus cereus]|nr:PLP-dependent aminotransferase family protein [Bacillus cereus]